jgi:hypothetical protein
MEGYSNWDYCKKLERHEKYKKHADKVRDKLFAAAEEKRLAKEKEYAYYCRASKAEQLRIREEKNNQKLKRFF